MISLSPLTSFHFISVKNVRFLYNEYLKDRKNIIISWKLSCYAKHNLCSDNGNRLDHLTIRWSPVWRSHYPEHDIELRTKLHELSLCSLFSRWLLSPQLKAYLLSLKYNSNFRILWLSLVPALNKSAIKNTVGTTR